MKHSRSIPNFNASQWKQSEHEKYYLSFFDMRINGTKEAWYRAEVTIH